MGGNYLEQYPDSLFSDAGLPCPVCQGTAFRYIVPADVLDELTNRGRLHAPVRIRVETFCVTCHREDAFYPDLRWNPSASDIAAAHRAARRERNDATV